MEKKIDFQKMAGLIVKNGGGTFHLSGAAIVGNGYNEHCGQLDRWSVGIVGVRFAYAADIHPIGDVIRALEDFFRLVYYFTDRPDMGNYIGAWIDGGILYLDIVRLIADKAEALQLAKVHGQKAIYNLRTGETANVPKVLKLNGNSRTLDIGADGDVIVG